MGFEIFHLVACSVHWPTVSCDVVGLPVCPVLTRPTQPGFRQKDASSAELLFPTFTEFFVVWERSPVNHFQENLPFNTLGGYGSRKGRSLFKTLVT